MQTKSDKNTNNDVNLVKLSLKSPNNFALIIEKYQKPIFYYLKRISNLQDEDIEDELQEIFLKIYRNLNSYDTKLKFSSWIYRIAHNHVISHYRKLKARPQRISSDWEINEQILDSIADDFNLNKEIDNKLLNKKITKTFSQMDFKYREVLVYKFFQDKTYDEISDIIKKPTGTVGTLINRAKKQFNKLYQQ